MSSATPAQTKQAEFDVLFEHFLSYTNKLKREWLAKNRVHSVNVYEVMTKIERDEVQRRIRQWGEYMAPLAEAWWKERGYGVTWPDDDSKPMGFYKLETEKEGE